ncbi:MAG: hypothetical protein JXR78_04265 [Victivallales bacterium]|nr:hypothetical protein [Victivallales bacterium]
MQKGKHGGLVAFAVSDGMPFTGTLSGEFTIRINTGKHHVNKVAVRHLEDIRDNPISFTRVGSDYIDIQIKNHISISMLKME